MRRLKTRQEFQAVLASPPLAQTQHFALHRASLVSNPGEHEAERTAVGSFISIAAMVPKRWARRAVTRNTIKRQIYALGVKFEKHLTEQAHLIRLRASFDRSNFPSASSRALSYTVRMELQGLFEQVTTIGANRNAS